MLELVVTIAIGAIILLILGGIFLAQGRFFDIQGAVSETQINAFQALDAVGQYASSAQSILSSRTINGTSYTSGTGTLVLQIPAIDSSGTILSNAYDYIAIGQDSSNTARFMFDIDSATGSARLNGKFTRALLVDTVIFRYNTVSPSSATVIDLFIQTAKTVRGQIIKMPLGKIYYLGTT